MNPCDFWTIRGCLMPIAVCSVDFGRSRALRTSDAARPTKPSTVSASAAAARTATSCGAATVAIRGGEREPGGAAQQREVDDRQRRRPFAQELQAGVDHRRCRGKARRRATLPARPMATLRRRRRPTPAWRASSARWRKCALAYSRTTPMKAGSTITSRDSHDVRHRAADRQPAPAGRGGRTTRDEARGGEHEGDEAAVEVEPRPPRRRQQVEQRADLDGERARRTGPARRRSAS